MTDPDPGDRDRFPVSVVAVGWVCFTWIVVLTPVVDSTPLRPLVVLPTALFVPGYVCQAALFGPRGDASGSPGALERLVVAVALSVAVSIAVGVALSASPLGVTAISTLSALTLAVGAFVGVIAFRYGTADASFPTDIEFGSWRAVSGRIAAGRSRLATVRRTDAPSDYQLSTVVVVLVVVLGACGAVGVGYLVVLHESPGYTQFSVTAANGSSDGDASLLNESTATPNNRSRDSWSFQRGETLRLVLVNGRSDVHEYTVVAIAQRVDGVENRSVLASRTLTNVTVTLEPGERWTRRHSPSVPWSGRSVRLVYRLYRGDETAPRAQLHRWVETDRSGPRNETTEREGAVVQPGDSTVSTAMGGDRR